MKTLSSVRGPILGALALCWALSASALTDEEVFRTFRFNFVNPGGRALAMGGAFVGIADDATAAAANPAGLTNLLSPEMFIEIRGAVGTTQELSNRVGDPRLLPGDVLSTSIADPENIVHPSFMSFVKPFDNWVFGLSRQEVLRTDVQTTNLFVDDGVLPNTNLIRATGRLETLLEYYNFSVAGSPHEKLALGATLTYARMDLESRTANELISGSDLEDDYATSVDDSDDDFAWSLGLLYKPHDKFHIGLVYRDGPELSFEEMIEDTRPSGNYPSADVLADFLGNRNLAAGGIGSSSATGGFNPDSFDDPLTFDNVFNVPDQYGIGFGYRPDDAGHWTIALDVVNVEYSDLEEGFVSNVNALTFPGDAPTCDSGSPMFNGSIPCDYNTPLATYEFDDAIFWRLGVEYLWVVKETTPVAIRAGVYVDPNVRLEADFGDQTVFISTSETFPSGRDITHYTLGFGLVLQEKFQIDFAADMSNEDNTFITSFIYHF
ncbi:MAG: outer membrane protein transport protein [Acidobacteriota bacterium]